VLLEPENSEKAEGIPYYSTEHDKKRKESCLVVDERATGERD